MGIAPNGRFRNRLGQPYLEPVDPFERLRSAGRRVTDPAEALAQAVAERVIEGVIQALDLNEIISADFRTGISALGRAVR